MKKIISLTVIVGLILTISTSFDLHNNFQDSMRDNPHIEKLCLKANLNSDDDSGIRG